MSNIKYSDSESLHYNEDSNDGLQIVLDSPTSKFKSQKDLSDNDLQLIASLEETLENALDEKAKKAKLTAQNVKTILKQVVTNEHVVALMKYAENPQDFKENLIPFEPKNFRTKKKDTLQHSILENNGANDRFENIPTESTKIITSKKILNNNNVKSPEIPLWIPSQSSVVHVLLNEELEDESDEEYIPHTKTKIINSKPDEEEANIARRTRSKLNLNSTPFEEIEKAFIPPDIHTDMYDMDCDENVWKEFLNTFTEPLDEIVKAPEDDEQDPEFNILAEDLSDEEDVEELRVDRAVTVSKKELNILLNELMNIVNENQSESISKPNETENVIEKEKGISTEEMPLHSALIESSNINNNSDNQIQNENIEKIHYYENIVEDDSVIIKVVEIPLLLQQIRQHIQLLTQNFLLTYEHPQFSSYAVTFKNCLLEFKNELLGKTVSAFYASNLDSALKLIENWEEMFIKNTKNAKEVKSHFSKIIMESIESKMTTTDYVLTIPPLIMKTIAYSNVFLYPKLLPRIPYKSPCLFSFRSYTFSYWENMLLAFNMEILMEKHKIESKLLKKSNVWKLRPFYKELIDHVTPWLDHCKLNKHIQKVIRVCTNENPIKHLYVFGKCPNFCHYVVPLEEWKILPPAQRPENMLPPVWKDYLYPKKIYIEKKKYVGPSVIVTPLYNPFCELESKYNFENQKLKTILPNKSLQNIQKQSVRRPKTRKNLCPCKTHNIFEIEKKQTNFKKKSKKQELKIDIMWRDMPSLTTPIKKSSSQEINFSVNNSIKQNNNGDENLNSKNNNELLVNLNLEENIIQECGLTSTSVKINNQHILINTSNKIIDETNNIQDIVSSDEKLIQKDNVDEIQELMKASSTVKNKKGTGGAEKKHAKLKKEFTANIAMITPESSEIEEEKTNTFVEMYLEKAKKILDKKDFDTFLNILNSFDEKNDDFKEFYKSIQSILKPKYPELSEEFLLFLTNIQAYELGELMPYFIIKDLAELMKKIQIYFKNQPYQIKKILKCLTELSEDPELTLDKLKLSILQFLKGNLTLTEWFLQLFPDERPSKILLDDSPYEVVDLCKELSKPPDEEIYETIKVPDVEDPYGGLTCICECHNMESAQYKTRFLHCTSCGLKFMQGKLFLQSGKNLRPAVVTFLTNPQLDHTKRLKVVDKKRSIDIVTSPKNGSPNKDDKRKNIEEGNLSRKRKFNNLNKGGKIKNDKRKYENKIINKLNEKKQIKKTPKIKKKITPESSSLSIQDTFPIPWTRDEDKIILETFQKGSSDEDIFKHISHLISHRTVLEIKNRFFTLMKLLQQMALCSTNNNNNDVNK